MEAFAGIDLAFAKRKRLPVCLCVWNEGRLILLPLAARDAPEPPRGYGNVASINPLTVGSFVDDTAIYLRGLEKRFDVSISRIAIDAPSDYRLECLSRRLAEAALDQLHIRCFTTPSKTEFETICTRVENHMKNGGLESTLPHANQLWMLVGFALFKRLGVEWECLEVYPQATMRTLGASSIHKSKADGVSAQLEALSRYTGWREPSTSRSFAQLREALKEGVRAPLHDAVDAYSSAWVAALAPHERRALGSPPNDVIWVPQLPGT